MRSTAAKLEDIWAIIFLQEVDQKSCGWNSICQIFILPPALFPGKNIPNNAESNRIFPGKGKEDKDFILTYLDSSMAEIFPH